MGGNAKNIDLVDLNLGAALLAKLAPITDTRGLRALRPEVLVKEWRITERQWAKIDLALRSRGYGGLGDYPPPPEKISRASSLKGKCRKMVTDTGRAPDSAPGQHLIPQVACARPLLEGKHSCLWHWLATQPIELQTEWADQRRRIAEDAWHNAATEAQRAGGYPHRSRVAETEWPEGHRWCAECQTMIPLFYCRGSRCVAHASRAAHASMVKTKYDFTREDYENLLAWQRGRCYICQQVPRSKRLAVDHDHRTDQVRGLLCANDEWGCNSTLRRLLNDKGMAKRALEYVERTPWERLQAGEASPPVSSRPRPPEAASVAPRATNDPFKGFL
jgi:hypothetical protein